MFSAHSHFNVLLSQCFLIPLSFAHSYSTKDEMLIEDFLFSSVSDSTPLPRKAAAAKDIQKTNTEIIIIIILMTTAILKVMFSKHLERNKKHCKGRGSARANVLSFLYCIIVYRKEAIKRERRKGRKNERTNCASASRDANSTYRKRMCFGLKKNDFRIGR